MVTRLLRISFITIGLIGAVFSYVEAAGRSEFVLENQQSRIISPTNTRPTYPWLVGQVKEPLFRRISPPKGYKRIAVPKGSFEEWLRGLPLRAGRPPVRLHDGSRKLNQLAHHSVLLVDVGKEDLQQCADAIIRLRAEYLYSLHCDDMITFRFTSGHAAKWSQWRSGFRPKVKGNRVSWSRTAKQDDSYRNFRKYLNSVFMFAGSASLSKELKPVKNPLTVRIGDVFIRGGFPGHAVLVADVAENKSRERVFLLIQSFMPAQDIHVLRNPMSLIKLSPWYQAKAKGSLITPEWVFRYTDLKRFPKVSCTGKNR